MLLVARNKILLIVDQLQFAGTIKLKMKEFDINGTVLPSLFNSSQFENVSWDEVTPTAPLHEAADFATIVSLSVLFFVIGSVGITGNLLVIYVIVSDRRMRRSVTNIFITNLAVSDFVIMVACVPDIVQFIQNSGWKIGLTTCKLVRFCQVFALYASVMTLLSVCVERYVAIIHPIKAHILCSRGRILLIIAFIWPSAMICASPNIFFHKLLVVTPGFTPCIVQFPHPADTFLFKYAEFTIFYLIPLLVQVVLYIYIGKRLFGVDALSKAIEPAVGKDKYAATIQARRGVVKMLIAGVTVYFISFSPHQVLLFYNTFSDKLFHETWSYLIFVNIMAYASSACNPLLYSVFSQKFRYKFRNILFRKFGANQPNHQAVTNNCKVRNVQKSLKTTVTEV